MSVRLMSLVFESDLPSTEKFVLLSMADYASDSGDSIFPSVETLAKKTSLTGKTVRETIKCLREKGYVILISVGGGRNTNLYKINVDKLKNNPLQNYPSQIEPSPTVSAPLTELPSTPNVITPESSLNVTEPLIINAQKNPRTKEDALRGIENALIENEKKRQKFIDLVDCHDFPDRCRPLAEAFVLSANRKGVLKKSEKGYWIEEIDYWTKNGVTPEIIQKAVNKNRENGLPVVSPKSITSYVIDILSIPQKKEYKFAEDW